MTRAADQVLVIEPIWNTEPAAASTSVTWLSKPTAKPSSSALRYAPITAPGTLLLAVSAGSCPVIQPPISSRSGMG
jgi:hypothetical protein